MRYYEFLQVFICYYSHFVEVKCACSFQAHGDCIYLQNTLFPQESVTVLTLFLCYHVMYHFLSIGWSLGFGLRRWINYISIIET